MVLAIIGDIAIVLGTYIAASDATFLAICRFLRAGDEISSRSLFFLSRGLGPALVSLVTYILFVISPHRSPSFYIVVVFVFFALLFVYGRRELSELKNAYSVSLHGIAKVIASHIFSAPLLITIFMLMCFLVLGIAYPIVTHDSLAAVVEARIMARDMSAETYMAVAKPDPETGYYTKGYRAPFLQMLYVWFSLVGGDGQADILARTVSPIYGIHCLLLLAYMGYRAGSTRHALWAIFLLSATPLFFYVTYTNGIDPPRLYFTYLSLLWILELIERKRYSPRLTLVAGAISGLALYCHLLSIVAVFSGMLGYLILSRQSFFWEKIKLSAVFLMAAVLAGAQFHYLINTSVWDQLERSFNFEFVRQWIVSAESDSEKGAGTEAEVVTEGESSEQGARNKTNINPGGERSPGLGPPPPSPPPPVYVGPVLETRGHGGSPLSKLLFGRLQMFTGIEYFGFIFYLLAASLVIWFRSPQKTMFEKLLVITSLFYCVIVLSGIRKNSWSNPRYIGTVIMAGAYFAAPLLVSLENRLVNQAHKLRKIVFAGLILGLIVPVSLATAIRGAKLEITNQGSFYSDFRSLRWLGYTFEQPREAVGRFWREYMGIRKAFRYIWASDREKLFNAHDYFSGIQYVNAHTDAEAQVLVFRDARFFYYADRLGYVWYHPDIMWPLRKAETAEDLWAFLRSKDITHILFDSYSETQSGYTLSKVGDLMADRRLTELVYEHRSCRVYELHETVMARDPPESSGSASTAEPRPE